MTKIGRMKTGSSTGLSGVREKAEDRITFMGDPLLAPPSCVVLRPNSLSLPFRTPATQASKNVILFQ